MIYQLGPISSLEAGKQGTRVRVYWLAILWPTCKVQYLHSALCYPSGFIYF